MTLGNIWLGSLQVQSITQAQPLSLAAFGMTSTVLSIASCVDRATLRIAGACTETLTIAVVPSAGTAYSTVIYRTSTSGVTSVFWQPDRPLFMAPGDYLYATVSNGDTTGTIYGGLIVLY